ncbi:MAG: M50 family metallopeptidase [Christensenellales bacterium]|jgi:stage IV sporulation protein FB
MKGLRFFGGKLKINLFIIPAIIIMVLIGMGDIVLYTIPVILLHEWAHVLAATALGMTITEMELLPFGCAAKMQCFAMSRAKEIIVAAAGPATNMVFACIVFIIDRYVYEMVIAEKLISSNIAIATINLLPALPLDGGRIARAAFASFMGYKRATRITSYAGVLFASIIVAVGIIAALKNTINPSFFILGFFLCLSSLKELKSAPYMLIRDFSGKRQKIDKRKTLSINRFAAMQNNKVSDIMREFEAGKYNIVTVLDNDMGVLGELDERQILDGMMEKGTHATLWSIFNQQ